MQRIGSFSLIVVVLLLSACAGPQTSVDKNARHVAYRIAHIHFDPNTRPLTTDNTRAMAHFLSQFYQLGKEDRAAGLTLAQAKQRVASFSQMQDEADSAESNPFTPEAQKSNFIQHSYTADQPEKRSIILLDGATATYWDGYNGRP